MTSYFLPLGNIHTASCSINCYLYPNIFIQTYYVDFGADVSQIELSAPVIVIIRIPGNKTTQFCRERTCYGVKNIKRCHN